jgi:succinate-semialdehyde dehydrogenase/glutarate-semialdehyde dehydrogenase
MQVMNPATGEVLLRYDTMSWEDVAAKLVAARTAFADWRQRSFEQRAALLGTLAGLLRERRVVYAEMMAGEMGKPVSQGRAEIEKCATLCEFYAEHGASFLDPVEVASEARRSFVSFQPLGPVLAVMPWNFPFWQVFRFAVPALLAGNTAVLKHASNVPSSAVTLESLFAEAGFPPGVFAAVLAESDMVSQMIAHPAVAAVTVTGSVPAGRAVARVAGENLKKTVLELGGSDAYVVLADADLDHAADVCAASRLINGGQSCIAAKRFVVERAVVDAFTERMCARLAACVVGDPLREDTELGPMAREDLRDELHEQVERSVAKGAVARLGGVIPARPGAWYPATLLGDVTPGMPVFDEEVFGPVAAVATATDADDAIRLANVGSFGLGAAVFTADPERGAALAERSLDAGACFVNAMVRSDPRLPFGGIKQSGYGRELGALGIREFVNAKTVWVA